jgi:glycyl-tRNA synthetase beta chain
LAHLEQAALEPGFDDLSDFSRRLESLVALSQTPDWNRLVIAAERTHNITSDFTPTRAVNQSLLTAPEELRLFSLYNSVRGKMADLLDTRDYLGAGKLYEETFAEPLHTFFEKVFVNVDDLNLRNNRLTLLKLINSLYATRVADLSQVPRSSDAGQSPG